MNKLSVVIITKNEEKFIADTVNSAVFADEVLVLDSDSIDKTSSIAKEIGARVEQQEWLGFGAQKNKAVDLANNDWVFVLDSDERITSELKNEIIAILENPQFDGYQVARLNNFFGKNIKTCGLYPDYSIRLFNRNKGRFNDVAVHESVQMDGSISNLNNHMLHLAYDTVDEFRAKQKKYASLSQKNKNRFKALISPIWTFFKLYFIKLGFLDGWRGFVIAKLYAQYTFWKYSK
ncbi:glycosyltransferase family 2 protein [Candidatus Woesearchaeota archaeon]|jgi:glycosyltransferase involved in cell wall biosynthesis|nr:glycosyltransferase family 2 protein [Candidatus Woesearchaeota archaeon]MBT7555425.1 glycosyltransferase family 2 protein [Candidatus Woesearchaeota archaeon]